MMSLFTFVLVGRIAGALGGWIVKDRGYGLLADIAIGVIGGLSGASFFSAFGITAGSIIGSVISTAVGATALIVALRAVQSRAEGRQ